MTITARERATYEEILALSTYSDYSPGEQYADLFLAMVTARGINQPVTVLDAGCGSGKGMLALVERGFRVTGCDLTLTGLVPLAQDLRTFEACLWRQPPRVTALGYDYVYCTDVLEHVPTVFVGNVIANLLIAARRGLFVSVCVVPDNLGAWIGKPLHQTVLRFDQWKDIFQEFGTVTDARDLNKSAIFMVTPR